MDQREIIVIPATQQGNRLHRPQGQLRVASYSRVSTDMEEQLTSFHMQKSYYTELILKNPYWRLVGTYADEGISGASAKKRPDFMRMIEHCKKGKIDLIITKSISRFARNTEDSIKYVRKLKALGIGILFEKENINTLDGSSELMFTMLSSMAQEELESLSKNVKMGKRMGMQQGHVTYRYKTFYGYKEGADGQPEIIPEEATTIRHIYTQYVAGQTPRSIAEDLNDQGILHRNQKPWTETTVRSLLTNERYSGDVILQKTYVEDPISKRVRTNNGELPKYYIKNNHVAIIDRDLYQQAQEEQAKRSSKPKVAKSATTENGKHSRLYALTGKLVCTHCGSPYRRVVWSKRNREKQAVWRCITRIDYGTDYCDKSPTVDEKSLHTAIMTAIRTNYQEGNQPPLMLTSELRKVLSKQQESQIDIGQLEQQIVSIIDQTMALVTAITNSQSVEEQDRLNQQIKALSDEGARLQAIVDQHKETYGSQDKVAQTMGSIALYLDSVPEDNQTYSDDLVRQIVHTIQVVDSHHITIYFEDGTTVQQVLDNQVRPLKKDED